MVYRIYALNYFNTPTKPMIITHEKPSINNRCEKSSRIDDSQFLQRRAEMSAVNDNPMGEWKECNFPIYSR